MQLKSLLQGAAFSLCTRNLSDSPYIAIVEYNPTDIRGQELLKAQRDAREKAARDREDEDLKWLALSKRGRRIIWLLLTQAGVFRLSFDMNALKMAFNEGNRSYGNRLLDRLNALCPEMYSAMTKENSEHGSSNDGNGKNSN